MNIKVAAFTVSEKSSNTETTTKHTKNNNKIVLLSGKHFVLLLFGLAHVTSQTVPNPQIGLNVPILFRNILLKHFRESEIQNQSPLQQRLARTMGFRLKQS